MDDGTKWALHLLLTSANGDSGGAGRVARFLISLWDGGTYKVDLQDLMYIDTEIFSAMLLVWQYLYNNNGQLEVHVTQEQMNPILALWGK